MPDIVLYNVKSKIRLWGGTLAEIGMTREKIEQAMKFAISNKKAIQESPKAGCYYCKKTYKPSKVVEFLEHEEIALCPKCGIDSVLPANSPYEPTNENLAELHQY